MGTGKPQKPFLSNISNNNIIPDENFPDYGNHSTDTVLNTNNKITYFVSRLLVADYISLYELFRICY